MLIYRWILFIPVVELVVQSIDNMLALSSIVAISVVAFFAYAGIMESFTRGMLVAATYKSNRPTRHHSTIEPIEPIVLTTPINQFHSLSNDSYVNISSTVMPTLSGGSQRVDFCHVENVMVALSPDGQSKKELTFKSFQFPFKRTNPLVCSWNVKVSDNCRRGLVTMKINERSRLSGEKGCTKGYYRVSPFMKEAKICGRINSVPTFQWFVEDQQPENVTITLKHNGLNDGYSEGLGFTLFGECLPDDSDLTIKKAIKSYESWLEQLSSRATSGLTVVLPDDVPLNPLIWETQRNVSSILQLFNVISDGSKTAQQSNNHTDMSTEIFMDTTISPITQFTSISSEQTDENNKTADALSSDDVTEPSLPTTSTFQSIRTTVRPSFVVDALTNAPEIPWLDRNSPLLNSLPIMRRRPLPTTKKPITRVSTSQRPPLTIFPARKRPTAQVSNDNPEIPWLILKSPADHPSLSEMYRTPSTTTSRPFITNHQEVIQHPIIRRPLVRFSSTTVRPASSSPIPWVILKSPQTNKESSNAVYPPKKPANVTTVKIPPAPSKVPIVDNQGIPWLILKSPDPHPSDSSSEIYYPKVSSNELKKRRYSFPGYFV